MKSLARATINLIRSLLPKKKCTHSQASRRQMQRPSNYRRPGVPGGRSRRPPVTNSFVTPGAKIPCLIFFSFPPESRDSRPETHNPKYDKMNTRPWSKRPALGRKRRRRQTCKKTADKTQPSEDVRDEAPWLDESDRRDAAANAEGKVISVQESSRGREPRRYAKVTSFLPC